jgi:hypothetical protein
MRLPALALCLATLAPLPAIAGDPFGLDRPYALEPGEIPGQPYSPGHGPDTAVLAYGGGHDRTAVALMIAGGACLLGGLIIGKTTGALIAVTGLGIGGYGLYLYLE